MVSIVTSVSLAPPVSLVPAPLLITLINMRSAPFAILFSDNLLQSKNIDYLCSEKDCENFNFLKITMNKVKLSLFALVAMMAASCVADPVMEGEGVAADKSPIAKIINSSDDAAAGKLIL